MGRMDGGLGLVCGGEVGTLGVTLSIFFSKVSAHWISRGSRCASWAISSSARRVDYLAIPFNFKVGVKGQLPAADLSLSH